MTWTKLSDDFADDCARVDLSDAAFRTHVEGLLWTMRRETGGRLDAVALRRFAESPEAADGVRELVEQGFWQVTPDGYLVLHHMEHQPEPEVLAARRAAEAERQRRKREKALSRRDDTRDDHRDDMRDPGRGGTGRGGTGKPVLEGDEQEHARESEDTVTCIDCGRPDPFMPIAGRCRDCYPSWRKSA